MSIAENLEQLRAALPAGVTLVAVSKTHPAAAIREAYDAGQRIFGENRPQEMAAKYALLPDDIAWHMIGHLQTNKVKLIAPFVAMIHSTDSARLLREISLRAIEAGRVIDVLWEIRIAREESKEGWDWEELTSWLDTEEWRKLGGVRFRGVMGVATNSDDNNLIHSEFVHMAEMFARLQERYFGRASDRADGGFGHDEGAFDTLSMGMSGDWPIAVGCGATMVRIGSLVFGERDYGGNR